jgi:hypothetical protein
MYLNYLLVNENSNISGGQRGDKPKKAFEKPQSHFI